jgi:hypothetical protein
MKKKIVVILGFFLLTAGCGGPRWEDARVEEQSHCIVRVQSQVESGEVIKQHFMHPTDIDPQTIAAFLSELAYMQPDFLLGDAKKTFVFQDKEVDRLAGPIAKAFATVNEDQRIAFTSLNRGGGLLFDAQRETTGLMFVDAEGKLNIAFSGINIEKRLDPEDAIAVRVPPGNPLEIADSKTPLIATGDYMQHHLQDNGKAYPMWLRADLGKVKTSAKVIEIEPSKEASDFDPALHRENIRSQLEYVKKLYDDGLISQSEYDAKRRELLEAIK